MHVIQQGDAWSDQPGGVHAISTIRNTSTHPKTQTTQLPPTTKAISVISSKATNQAIQRLLQHRIEAPGEARAAKRPRITQGLKRKHDQEGEVQQARDPTPRWRQPSDPHHQIEGQAGTSIHQDEVSLPVNHQVKHEARSELTSTGGPSKRDGPQLQLIAPKRAKPLPIGTSNTDATIARLLQKD